MFQLCGHFSIPAASHIRWLRQRMNFQRLILAMRESASPSWLSAGNRAMLRALILLAAFASLPLPAFAASPSDAQVRQQMIAESIAAYSGHCPCPYNLASNGSRCGKRSAWSKAGGYAPLCYPVDIADEAVKA